MDVLPNFQQIINLWSHSRKPECSKFVSRSRSIIKNLFEDKEICCRIKSEQSFNLYKHAKMEHNRMKNNLREFSTASISLKSYPCILLTQFSRKVSWKSKPLGWILSIIYWFIWMLKHKSNLLHIDICSEISKQSQTQNLTVAWKKNNNRAVLFIVNQLQ